MKEKNAPDQRLKELSEAYCKASTEAHADAFAHRKFITDTRREICKSAGWTDNPNQTLDDLIADWEKEPRAARLQSVRTKRDAALAKAKKSGEAIAPAQKLLEEAVTEIGAQRDTAIMGAYEKLVSRIKIALRPFAVDEAEADDLARGFMQARDLHSRLGSHRRAGTPDGNAVCLLRELETPIPTV